MQLLILGGTGPTGQQLVKQSLEKLHHVTVLVRNPAKINLVHENLKVVVGDVLDKATVTKLLEGKDAVLSALGVGKSLISHSLIQNVMSVLIPSMQAANVKRVIFLSAFGVGETFKQANFLQKLIFRLPLRSNYKDKEKADAMLRNSSPDWTLICPVVLTNGPYTGTYKAAEIFAMKGMPTVSRADVADFMIKQLTDNTYIKKTAIIMS